MNAIALNVNRFRTKWKDALADANREINELYDKLSIISSDADE